MPTPQPFPALELNYGDTDANPGIQLFGRRFFSDQTIMEYLVELLLVCHSPKSINSGGGLFNSCLPDWDQLQAWHTAELGYIPPVRLALKLFSFLGASKLETRHNSHKQQYSLVLKRLRQAIQTDGTIEKQDVLRGLENLLLGFQGAGSNRTWCAQVFVPLCSSLLASEAIWQQSKADKNGVSDWREAIKYFSTTQKLFMARGGELLYLQLCNAFRSREKEFEEFAAQLDDLTPEERKPRSLHNALQHNLRQITGHAPQAVDRIALLIDEIDGFTAERTNRNEEEPVRCGWCPEESWREGYLFAVEINRLCMAAIDPIERIELLMLGCAMQVLRSLCAQSVRYANIGEGQSAGGGGLGYAWIVSDPEGNERGLKHLSQRNLQVTQRVIQQALRDKDIQENADKHPKGKEKLYKEADNRYGHKLFLSLAKKLGFIVPQRGPGARFVFNDKIVRYLVLALVPPGERRTYDDFKSVLYAHYGIALEGNELKLAAAWSDLPQLHSTGTETGAWLADMLKASGFLIHLSDACSLVHNPFSAAAPETFDEPKRKP